jgi:hypothetical protein
MCAMRTFLHRFVVFCRLYYTSLARDTREVVGTGESRGVRAPPRPSRQQIRSRRNPRAVVARARARSRRVSGIGPTRSVAFVYSPLFQQPTTRARGSSGI